MGAQKNKKNDLACGDDLKNRIIKIGTRTSKLALAQVAEVHLMLDEHFPNLKVEIQTFKTSGDKIQDRSLADIGGKGLFIKELEEALLENKIDIAIHSAKDVPPIIDLQTEIGAFTFRLDPRDCLISKKYSSIAKLPKNAKVGTSSPRRSAFLLRERPDLRIVNFRGNVDTRLKKVFDDEEVDATILAVSGLERLGKNQLLKNILPIEQILPSGGQGSLALQIRNNDSTIKEIVSKINDPNTHICLTAERTFLRELGASCSTPVGVFCEIKNDQAIMKVVIIDYDGQSFYQAQDSCSIDLVKAVKIAEGLAKQVKKEAKDLLKKLIN